MNTMNDAFADLIKDAHNAEKQLVKALPKMMQKASTPELKEAIKMHLEETRGHVTKLEEIAQICGFKPGGKACLAMKGLIEEADEHLKEGKPGPVMDAVMISSAQKVEHYEISQYGTARTWAQDLGFESVVPLIESILHQEEAADRKLNEIAVSSVNPSALQESGDQKGMRGKVKVI